MICISNWLEYLPSSFTVSDCVQELTAFLDVVLVQPITHNNSEDLIYMIALDTY